MVIVIEKYTYSTYYFIMDKMEGIEIMQTAQKRLESIFRIE